MTAHRIQRQLAEFVVSAPPGWGMSEVAAIVRHAWLDTLSVSIAGARTGVARGVLAYAGTLGVDGATHPWLSTQQCSLETAALVDAVMAHALDYDDVTPAWRGHPSAVVFPALGVLARHGHATVDDVVQAYIVGFEVGAQLGRMLAGRHYERGWHSTSTIGVIAATAAGCRLLRLSTNATSAAIGFASAQASGVQASFGSDAKPLQAGFAAAGAVRACLLAASGIGAGDTILDGPKGFIELYSDGRADDPAVAELGALPTAITRHGIEMKRYPICYAAHRAIDAALEIRNECAIDPDAIEGIEIEGTPTAHQPLLLQLPSNAQEARFSVEFGVACALLDGGVRLGSFTQDLYARSQLQALMQRSHACEVEGAPTPRRATVRVRMHDGRVHERTVGDPGSGGDLADARMRKVIDCLESAGVADEAAGLYALFENEGAMPVTTMIARAPFARIRDQIDAIERSPPRAATAGETW